jgi:hypothetical protein
MSVSGVSSFLPVNDPRADFERLREAHSKGPHGYSQRRLEDSEGRQSAGASALSDTKDMMANAQRSAAVRKLDISA